jgi:Beta-propeller repeat
MISTLTFRLFQAYCLSALSVMLAVSAFAGPRLAWSSFLGGSDSDGAVAITIDATGNLIMAGGTLSANFPNTLSSSHQIEEAAIFVSKFSPHGTLLWSTLLGGNGYDTARAVTCDATGNIFVSGTVTSSGLATPGAWRTEIVGKEDAFLAQFTPGGTLQWLTYFGGEGRDAPEHMVIDAQGMIYIAGQSRSSHSLATPGAEQEQHGGGDDGFVACFDSQGMLDWATYLGGRRTDTLFCIASNPLGGVCVAGYSYSDDFPTYASADPCINGGNDAVAAYFTSDGRLTWSTFLGGSDQDELAAIACGASGEIYLAGSTRSDDFPAPLGSNPQNMGEHDGLLLQLSPAGHLLSAQLIGGAQYDYINAIAIKPDGSLVLAGATQSNDFPIAGDSANTLNEYLDLFCLEIDTNGALRSGLRMSGNDVEIIQDMALSPAGSIYMTGFTTSTELPQARGFQSTQQGGDSDAFIMKLESGRFNSLFELAMGWNETQYAGPGDWNGDAQVDAADLLLLLRENISQR